MTSIPISHLSPGPQDVTFTGLITHIISSYAIESTSEQKPNGMIRLIISDETGSIQITLYYIQPVSFKLGGWLSVRTTHISSLRDEKRLGVGIGVSVFPERDRGCALKLIGGGLWNGILYGDGVPVFSMRDLKCHDTEVKILVCVVRVGGIEVVNTKAGSTFQTRSVSVVDMSTDSPFHLSVSNALFSSVADFVPLQTVLLITSPRLLSESSRRIKLTAQSKVFVNPSFDEAGKLRRFVARIYPPCNEGEIISKVFDDGRMEITERRQYTFALFLELISLVPLEVHVGYISAIVTGLNLVSLAEREELFCIACPGCGRALHSNANSKICGNSECSYARSTMEVKLRLNPRVLDGLADESGGFVNNGMGLGDVKRMHNLVVTDKAWKGFLCGSMEEIGSIQEQKCAIWHAGMTKLGDIEQRTKWKRLTLIVGWTGCGDDGRVVVLDVVC